MIRPPKTIANTPSYLDKIKGDYDKIIVDKNEVIDQQKIYIQQLEEALVLQRQYRFGASSEKAPGQGELFNEAEETDAIEDDEAEESDDRTDSLPTKAKGKKQRGGRKPLPDDLPRIRIEHDLSDEEKVCACGCQRQLIGEETSEQLDVIPAKIQVLVHVRKKYACSACETEVQLADLPNQPIPKSMASPGLLAYIATAKYQDGLPLHRQESQFKRINVSIPRNTLARWMIRVAKNAQSLWNLLEERLLSGHYVHADETPVQVLNETDRLAQNKSYMWVRVSGLPDKKVILFDYSPSRAGYVAKKLFEGYSGYLQTDDYAGYNAVCGTPEMTQLGCWAHARRKFVEAQKAIPKVKGKKAKVSRADMAVNLIGKLYGIERRIKNCSPEERYQVRQTESLPVLSTLKHWPDKTIHEVLPKGLLGKALGYLHKNWLFSATPKGAHASAMLYSLIETAKANGLAPFDYLCLIFKALPLAESVEDIEQLLPWRVDTKTLS